MASNETDPTPPEKDEDLTNIRERLNELANLALDEAFKIVRIGVPARKDPMIRSIITNLSRTLSKESSDDFSNLRLAFEELMAQTRGDGESPSMDPPSVLDYEANPPSFASDYSDEEFDG